MALAAVYGHDARTESTDRCGRVLVEGRTVAELTVVALAPTLQSALLANSQASVFVAEPQLLFSPASSTRARVSTRTRAPAYVSTRARVSTRTRASAYVSTRTRASAYVSTRTRVSTIGIFDGVKTGAQKQGKHSGCCESIGAYT